MSSGGTRLGLEADAAKKYGLDPIKDHELFDFVWDWLVGGGCDPEVGDAAEDYDACMEHYVKVFAMGARRGKDAASTVAPATSTGMKRTDEVTEHIAVRVKLSEADSARQWAFTEYLHKTAALEREVMIFRSEVLGGPHKTLARSEALHRLEEATEALRRSEAAEIPGDRTLSGAVELVVLPEGDFGRRFRVGAESDWGRLSKLAGWLSRKYPWDEAQATAFVLCGDRYSDDKSTVAFTPPVARVGHRQFSDKGHAAHPYQRVVITMEVASWVSSDKVKKTYSQMQRELNGGRRRGQSSLRNIEVFRFVLGNSSTEMVDVGESLARLVLPPWRDLREGWDKRYPPGHAWHYGPRNVQNFHRDFGIGQAAVLGDKDGGLLGIPGEPRTSEQQLEDSKKRIAGLSRRLPPNTPRLPR